LKGKEEEKFKERERFIDGVSEEENHTRKNTVNNNSFYHSELKDLAKRFRKFLETLVEQKLLIKRKNELIKKEMEILSKL